MLACCVITVGPRVEDTGTPPASCRDADGAMQHRLHSGLRAWPHPPRHIFTITFAIGVIFILHCSRIPENSSGASKLKSSSLKCFQLVFVLWSRSL